MTPRLISLLMSWPTSATSLLKKWAPTASPSRGELVGIDLGWKAVAEISFGGPGCVSRARLGEEVVRRRLEPIESDIEEIRYDLVGMTSLFWDRLSSQHPAEVRLRVAARCRTREAAVAVGYEVKYLYFGPAGAGGATQSIVP